MTDFPVRVHSMAMRVAATAVDFSGIATDSRDTLADFRGLYHHHAKTVWRLMLRLGLREDLAEDALQEVFLVAFRRRGEFEGRSSLRTWLCGIAIRVARRARARAQVRASREAPMLDDSLLSRHALPPESAAERNEALGHALALLDTMDTQKREVFVLCEVEQMLPADVAVALGVPLNTVYSRLRLARQDFEQGAKRLRARDGWRT